MGRPTRGRARAPVEGGYQRKTLSLPTELLQRFEMFLKTNQGMTLSTAFTKAGEAFLETKGAK